MKDLPYHQLFNVNFGGGKQSIVTGDLTKIKTKQVAFYFGDHRQSIGNSSVWMDNVMCMVMPR